MCRARSSDRFGLRIALSKIQNKCTKEAGLDLRESEGAVPPGINLSLSPIANTRKGPRRAAGAMPAVPRGLRELPADPEPASGTTRRPSRGAGRRSAAGRPALGVVTAPLPGHVTKVWCQLISAEGGDANRKRGEAPPSPSPRASDMTARLSCAEPDRHTTALFGSFCFARLYKGHRTLTGDVDGPDNCLFQELPGLCGRFSRIPGFYPLDPGSARLLPGCDIMDVSRHYDGLPV